MVGQNVHGESSGSRRSARGEVAPPESRILDNEVESRGAEKMTAEHQMTTEEETYQRLLAETWEMLSEAARTVFKEARSVAYKDYMVRSYGIQPQEIEAADEKMRLAAAELTEVDRVLLAKLVRAALVACASIDPFDYDTLTGYGTYGVNLHWYYRTTSDMVRDILYEQIRKREWAETEWEDPSDVPF